MDNIVIIEVPEDSIPLTSVQIQSLSDMAVEHMKDARALRKRNPLWPEHIECAKLHLRQARRLLDEKRRAIARRN